MRGPPIAKLLRYNNHKSNSFIQAADFNI